MSNNPFEHSNAIRPLKKTRDQESETAIASESFARFMAIQCSKKAENQKDAERKTIMPDESSESSKATQPLEKVGTGKGIEREMIISSREDVIGNDEKGGTLYTDTGCLKLNKCKKNFTNHHIATVQQQNAQNVPREKIAKDLAEDKDLASGVGVTEETRLSEIRTKVELWCSRWAPKHSHSEKVRFV